MTGRSTIGHIITLLALATGSAHASPILDVSSALTLADPIQLGRLSRNNLPQDWTGGEPFPGVITPLTPYHYHVYLVNVGMTPFIQIDVDSTSVNTFVSAYDTSYAPDSGGTPNFGFDSHWLGDAGASGNFGGVDPRFFQVLIPQNHDLLIVVSNTMAGDVGLSDPFHLIAEGFVDTSFTDSPPAVPEPATLVLVGGGLIVWAFARRRGRRCSH